MIDVELPGAAMNGAQVEDAISIAGLATIPAIQSRRDALEPICTDQIARVEAAALEHERRQESERQAAEILKREQGTLARLTAGASAIEGRIAELKDRKRSDRAAKAHAEREAERIRRRAIENGLIVLGA